MPSRPRSPPTGRCLPGAWRHLWLYPDQITFAGGRRFLFLFVTSYTGHAHFAHVSPAYSVISFYSWTSLRAVLTFAASALAFGAAWQFEAPAHLVAGLGAWAGLTFLWALLVAWRTTLYRFVDTRLANHPAFGVAYCWPFRKAACEAFVAEVVRAIEALNSGKAGPAGREAR